MKPTTFIDELRNTLRPYNRGLLPPKVEEKIRENVFSISETMIERQGAQKFFEVSQKMQHDWRQSLSQDIRFGREEDTQKGLTKLLTMELILSHPQLHLLKGQES